MRKDIVLLMLAGLVCIGIIAACTSTDDPPQSNDTRLVIFADDVTGPVAQILINAFETTHPNFQIVLQNPPGLQVFDTDDNAQLAALTIEEPDPYLFSGPIAYENVILISQMALDQEVSISESMAKDIIAGRMTNWEEITGENVTIELVMYFEDHPLRSALGGWLGPEPSISSEARVVTSQDQMDRLILAQPSSLGVTASSLFQGTSGVLSVNGITAYLAEKPNSRYPIQVPVFFVSSDEPDGDLAAFFNWLLSADGRLILEQELVTR